MSDNNSELVDLSEPYLNYTRLQDDIEKQAESEVYSAIAIHERYIALGTNSGKILLFSNKNKLFKIFKQHIGKINAISIDKAGNTIASAGEDGFVYVQSLSDNSRLPHKYTTAVRALRIDPTSKDKLFVCGGLKGQLILNKKSWFSYQDMVIHENEGPISVIAYSYPFVAWCNEYGTKIFNVETETSVTFVQKPKGVPETNQCRPRLCWYGNSMLCIGWGSTLNTVRLSFKNTAANTKVWYGESGVMHTLDYWVTGLGIYDDTHVTVLSFYPSTDGTAEPPAVNVVSLQTGETVSEECLPVRGYEQFTAQDYSLETNVTAPSSQAQPLFLLTPRTVVRITSRSLQDHIDWAVEHNDFERAIVIAMDRANGFSTDRITQLCEQYLDYLFATDEIEKAAQLCPSYLGKDPVLWERWIARFNGIHKLHVLLPYIPLSDPRLPLPVYTLVLNYFLYNDVRSFLALLRSWPRPQGDGNDLYDPKQLLSLLEEMAKNQRNQKSQALQEALSELYAMTGDMEKAVNTYLDNGVVNVEDSPFFRWVEDNRLIQLVKGRALSMFRLNSQQAAVLLVEHMAEVDPHDVVQQLSSEPRFQEAYLRELFNRRTSEYNTEEYKSLHALQLDLLLQFDSPDLLFFLETSQEYDVPTALNRCLHSSKPRTREAIYLYSRLGDTSRALHMIVQDLGDVDMALEFVQKWKDRDLWDDLIKYSVAKPTFVGALLDRAGEYINAITLVQCIPPKMEIPQLKEKLIHVLDNYSLELELRQGCNTILTSDMAELYERLVKSKMAGIRLEPNALCTICQQELFQIRKATRTCPPPAVIAFHCSHLYHKSCLEHVCGRLDNVKEGEPVRLRCIRCESGESQDDKGQGLDAIEMQFELQEETNSD